MQLHRGSSVLELDARYVRFPHRIRPYNSFLHADAGHFDKASIFDPDPEVGIGGFGKEEDNYVVTDGAFAHFPLAYPYPHELRRKYTPHPYFKLDPSWSPYRNVSSETTFTRDEVHKVVTGYRGDFKKMQVYAEDVGRVSINLALPPMNITLERIT